MGAPLLTAYAQGVGSVPADSLNTYVQGTSFAIQLRTFTGLTGMNVLVGGNAAVGDGGAGVFYWSAASTATDNGTTIIAPAGSATGRWLRLGYLTANPLNTLSIGAGVPASSLGNNGDVYIRSNGTAGSVIYQKAAGVWTAVL